MCSDKSDDGTRGGGDRSPWESASTLPLRLISAPSPMYPALCPLTVLTSALDRTFQPSPAIDREIFGEQRILERIRRMKAPRRSHQRGRRPSPLVFEFGVLRACERNDESFRGFESASHRHGRKDLLCDRSRGALVITWVTFLSIKGDWNWAAGCD